MPKPERSDCFEVCENYGHCFKMACKSDNLAEQLFLENIMETADRQRHECDEGRCAILGAARVVVERHRQTGGDFGMPALRYYRDQLRKDELAGQQ